MALRIPPKAFVVMPLRDEVSDDFYRLCIKPTCEESGLGVVRADEIFSANPVLDDIVGALNEASVVIADISGRNANVFYELGISHTLKPKQTIMVTRDKFRQVPFDVSHFRIIQYKNTEAGRTRFRGDLRKTLQSILRDYKSIYRDEFNAIIQVFDIADQEPNFYQLLGLAKSPVPLKPSERFDVYGHRGGANKSVRSHSIAASVQDALEPFVRLAYVEVIGEVVALTDKGKAFVEILEQHEFVCDMVNGHVLTPGYKPGWEKQ